jgi:predicted nuclease of predicted toxin-antitoxin system
VRFLADMGVSPRVVQWLREQGHDASHLRDEGLQRLPDGDIFLKAVAEQRVIVTFDLDFSEILALSSDRTASVVVFRLRNTRTENVIARLQAVIAQSSEALEEGAIIIIEDARHRIRRLPVGRR